ncbi:MAG TPA: glycosyltransferase family 39 protein [Nitrososphaeraceae archaeon]|nr:glycosyltransferase family 39 protein [Nitrososphaeraceae archaeon]
MTKTDRRPEKHSRLCIFLLLIILVASGFTHLWNPVGFPTFHVDEGHYMRRAMQVMQGLGPQESRVTYDYLYDHPYFGQIFLAGALSLINYPDSLNPSGDRKSIEMLYLVPRVLMGILAVFDTFLVYKIAQIRYNMRVAFISSALFAVMPVGWMLRGIFLDSILLPFLLLSILFAVYYSKRAEIGYTNNGNYKSNMLLIFSGIFLGLAIFTKVPVVTMIPLVMFLIMRKGNGITKKSLRHAGIWLIPVIFIPMIWPLYAISVGQFDEWIEGVLYQAVRESIRNLRTSILLIFDFDPLMLILGGAGIIYSVVKRDYFILLWTLPYLIFLYGIGWVTHFHWIMLFPALCIVSSVLIDSSVRTIKYQKIKNVMLYGIVSAITLFGFLTTTALISSNLNSEYINLYSYVVKELTSGSEKNDKFDDGITLIGSHRTRALMWIPKYVFNNDFIFRDTDLPNDNFTRPLTTKHFILVADQNLFNRLTDRDYVQKYERERRIASLYYNSSETVATFNDIQSEKYEFMMMRENHGFGKFIEVRKD